MFKNPNRKKDYLIKTDPNTVGFKRWIRRFQDFKKILIFLVFSCNYCYNKLLFLKVAMIARLISIGRQQRNQNHLEKSIDTYI